MSDNYRFDPYTGDPVPEENTNQNPYDTVPPTSENVESNNLESDPVNPYGQSAPDAPSQDTTDTTNTNYTNQDSYPTYSATDDYQNQQSTQTDNFNTNKYGADGMYKSNPNQYYTTGEAHNQGQYNPYNGAPNTLNQTPNNNPERIGSNLALASIITGIASIIFSFCSFCICPFFSFGLGIAAIICGIKARDQYGQRRGQGTAGIITGIIGLVLTVLITVGMIIITLTSSDFRDSFRDNFERNFNKYNNQNSQSDNNFNYTFPDDEYNNNLYDNDNFFEN